MYKCIDTKPSSLRTFIICFLSIRTSPFLPASYCMHLRLSLFLSVCLGVSLRVCAEVSVTEEGTSNCHGSDLFSLSHVISSLAMLLLPSSHCVPCSSGALSAIVAKMENFFFFQKTPDCLRSVECKEGALLAEDACRPISLLSPVSLFSCLVETNISLSTYQQPTGGVDIHLQPIRRGVARVYLHAYMQNACMLTLTACAENFRALNAPPPRLSSDGSRISPGCKCREWTKTSLHSRSTCAAVCTPCGFCLSVQGLTIIFTQV